MAVIETKYSVGDVVYFAGTTTERKRHPCPDCKGERVWKTVSPAGQEYEFGCPRCSTRYMHDRELSLDYTAHVPTATRMTIGSVQFNSARGSWDSGARYMCVESGIGSGTVYDERCLFTDEANAIACATAKATKANSETPSLVALFNKTLEISDYELSNAALKLAKEAESRASSMLYNLHDLFEKIEDDEADKESILEAVDDYKRHDWTRDKEEAAREAA